MKKYLVSTAFLILFASYAVSQYFSVTSGNEIADASTTPQDTSSQSTPPPDTSAVVLAAQSQSTNTDSSNSSGAHAANNPNTTSNSSGSRSSNAKTTASGQYVDGTYTGSSIYAYYGYVQVRATISGGKLADVTFLQYPNDRNESRYINGQAMPILKSEAITAQSANVSGVSGASDTSAAFRQSLNSALSQATA